MMAMHVDLMEGVLYAVSDLKIDGTDFLKVLWQGLLFRCVRTVELWGSIGEHAGRYVALIIGNGFVKPSLPLPYSSFGITKISCFVAFYLDLIYT